MNSGIRVALAMLALCAAALAGGCSSGGTIRITGSEGKVLERHFPDAYFTSFTPGEYDIVLMDDEIADAAAKKPEGVIEPRVGGATRHIIHIHAYWAADSAIHATPAGVNAAIDWYRSSLTSASLPQWSISEGAGLVILTGKGKERAVEVAEATLKPAGAAAGVQPAKMRGAVTAQRNDQRVRDVLDELAKIRPATPTRPAK